MNKIWGWIFPKDERFFDMLEEQSKRILESAQELDKFINLIGKIDTTTKIEYKKKLKQIEKEGDILTHSTIDALNKIFITPIDKEDIHRLIILLDDFLDLAKDVANRLVIYKIEKIPSEIFKLNKIVLECAVEVNHLIKSMRKLEDIERHTQKINTLEEEADDVCQEALGELFKEGNDPLKVIKLMDIYESLEIITDKCKEIANVVWNTGVKHA